MNIFVANLILYTPENGVIPRVPSIKDTMIYDLCLAMLRQGHQVTLYAADAYRPTADEEYPFPVLWGRCRLAKIFKPSALPFTPGLTAYMRKHRGSYDLVLSSEVFSLASLQLTRTVNGKLLVWHELAKHNRMMREIPSRVWYGVVARIFFRRTKVVARSAQAREFIRRFCPNTAQAVIDHGVNLSLFRAERQKEDYFVVCSQLIPRKQIDGIIDAFADFLGRYADYYRLLIIGDGQEREKLVQRAAQIGISGRVRFMGKMTHEAMVPHLARARGLLVNTRQDNNMVSIVESIAVGTPVLTTSVPYNAAYIREFGLGIVEDGWGSGALHRLVEDGARYVENCLAYREKLGTDYQVGRFVEMMR